MSKLAQGMCDSMLTAVALTARCPILVCPAMDHDMYENPATRENMQKLRSFGHEVMEAAEGELASGLIGKGRLPEPDTIFRRASEIVDVAAVSKNNRLAGKTVLVTAGPTREALDPVRFLSNRSTGTMGYEIAAAAARRGAEVILVSGPTDLACPDGVKRMSVVSAAEMNTAVGEVSDADIVFMVAAVADYAPEEFSDSKLKKTGDALTLKLSATPDILKGLGAKKAPGQCLVGFALETDDGVSHAKEKLERKNLDWIVLNNPNESGAGFGPSTNRVTIIGRDGSVEEVPLMAKREVAEFLLDHVTTG
jgi:phosphopantothenoylcysteine decarboxylase/phosphopantothenate--cysteine ligase